MASETSNKRLIEGVTRLLREEVTGWSTNSQHNVANVWPQNTPEDSNDEFPRGVVDVISGDDIELSVDLDIKLREAILRVVVFSDANGEVETLIERTEDAIEDHWDESDPNGNPYLGDWSFREVDGFAQMSETEDSVGDLEYSRYQDFVFECVRQRN
jgi:hypothetical protein